MEPSSKRRMHHAKRDRKCFTILIEKLIGGKSYNSVSGKSRNNIFVSSTIAAAKDLCPHGIHVSLPKNLIVTRIAYHFCLTYFSFFLCFIFLFFLFFFFLFFCFIFLFLLFFFFVSELVLPASSTTDLIKNLLYRYRQFPSCTNLNREFRFIFANFYFYHVVPFFPLNARTHEHAANGSYSSI